jgi:hypothetical protein
MAYVTPVTASIVKLPSAFKFPSCTLVDIASEQTACGREMQIIGRRSMSESVGQCPNELTAHTR